MKSVITSDILLFKSLRLLLLSIIIFTLATGGTLPLMAQQKKDNPEGTVFSKKYIREEGKPRTVEDNFSVGNPGDDFLLLVQNGEGGQNRVSSAIISLNGNEVVTPDDFNQQVDLIEKPVTLQKDNVIAVEVRGKPGGFIIVYIIQTVVNNPPEITSTPVTEATEEVLYTYDVEATDPDPGDELTYSLTTSPTGMTINAESGLIQWTPTNEQVGDNSVVVEVSDLFGATDTQSFTITVANVNDPPAITSTPITTASEDALYTYDVDATDPDIGDVLTYSLTTSPTGMTIHSATGLIQWTPTNEQVGENGVTVQVSDAAGATDTQSFTITVANVNDPPLITSTPITTASEDALYTYDVDATDPDIGDVLTYSLTTSPAGMTIHSATGLIQWTPTNEQVGDNNVTVQVVDLAGATDTQSFTITVANVNDPPMITSTPVTTATEDALYTYDVDATDPDLGDVLTYSLTTSPAGMTIDTATGLIEWTPISEQVGDNDVTVQVADLAGATDTQSFIITVANVNDPPVITSTPVTTATEDTLYTYDVDATDPDLGDVLTYSLTASPAGMTIDSATGLIQWTPTKEQVGDNDVVVQVSDATGATDTQSFAITVEEVVNNPPVITSTPITTGTEGVPYQYDVDATDPDVGDVLAYSLTTSPAGMTIDAATGLISWTPTETQAGSHDVTVEVSDGRGGSDIQSFTIDVAEAINAPPVITSTPVTTCTEDVLYTYDVEATDPDLGDVLTYSLTTSPAGMTIHSGTGLIEWTPTNAQVGDNSVTVRVEDTGGLFDTQDFTITVANVNDPPEITSTPITTAIEDALYTYDVDATDPDVGDVLTYSLTTSPVGMTIDAATGLIEWTPTNEQVGDNDVVARVTDLAGDTDTQSYTITISNVNDPPVITSSPVTTATEDALYSYDVDATDPDVGDVLAYSLTTSSAGMTIDAATGLIEWTPTNEQIGDNDVIVQVTDLAGDTDTQSFTITVSDVNDPPLITSTPVTTATEDTLYSYDVDATDPDLGDVLTYSLTTSPAGMTIDAATGLIEWTPTNEQVGDNDVVVQVTDLAGDTDTQSFTITVSDVNDPPVITSSPVTTATEDALYSYDVDVTDPDVGDVLTYSLTTSPAGMTIDSGTGLIEWTPTNEQVGNNDVVAQVTDLAGDTDTQSFTITVTNVNNPPVITSTPVTTATEDTLYSYDVDATDPDVGDVLSYSFTTSPAGMTIDSGTGLIEWTPTNEQVGNNDVVAQVTDLAGDTDTQSFTITVTNVNDPPVITSTPVTTATEDILYSYDMDATDPDVGDVLAYSLTTSPAGMTIDAATGLIEWTPTNEQVGDNDVVVQVTDLAGATDTQSFTITVANVNDPPVITSSPVTTATEDTLYSYDVDATDPDVGDVLAYSLTTSPAGMTIDSGTGLIQWTPTNEQVGNNDVVAQVTDLAGATDTQSFTITVANVNDPPSITSTPVTTATEDVLYTYDVDATDPDLGDVLTYSLTIAPVGMTIDTVIGLIQWAPTSGQLGDNDVVVEVRDIAGATDNQSFTITVGEASADYIRPEVDVTVIPDVVNVGDTVTITVNATDNVGVVSRALTVNGVDVPLDASGTATYTSDAAGVFTAVGTALDAAGNEGSDSEEFRFLSPGDTTPPTVAISSPANEAKISVPTDIIGTASDDTELTLYKLEYSVKDRNEFIEFASGTSPVTNGVLGTLDPTTLRNGLYDVKLTAEDASGNYVSTARTYQLEGEMKVGNFTISFNDLTIPVAGIPITITRTYDSRVKTKGDFGVGWELGIKAMSVQENRVPGEGWQLYCKTSIFGTCIEWGIEPSVDHSVVVTMEGARDQEFAVGANTTYADPSGLAQGNLTFTAKSGTFSTLEALDNVTYDFLFGDELYDFGFNVINPNRYRLTTTDGNVYIINQSTGLESITDTNGNTITLGPGGIIHSAGKSVTFARDAQDRITTITDPMGNTIQYEYDFYGDLVSVTDQEGNTTQFTYNSSHGLLDIIDPRGITPARNEYDDEGRLIAIVDADGNRVEFTHNIGTRQEVVRDRLGNVTVYEYDDDGNVVSQTDALGNTTSYTYDARGNKLSETDPLGNTTAYTYDAQDNMLSQTDPLGNRTDYTYNSRGQVLTTTDPLGNVTTNTYDANGNLTSITDPLGNVTTHTYDAAGNLTSITDPLGNVTTYTYDAVGNMISQTDPLGSVTTYTYDSNGNQLSQTTTRTTPSGVETITTTNVYDGMNRLVQTIDPYGNTTSIEYNAIGKQSATVDKLGNRTEYEYDARGNLTRVIYPDGTDERYTYDAENRKLTSTDRAGITTSYTYDVLGRPTRTTFPDGTFTQTEYDAAGQVTREIDERGNATQYAYDAAGRNTQVTDALGNTTSYEYDGNGNRIWMTDANGNATQYEYDASNRRIQTIFPDGTSTSTTYNALGRKISETDQAGNITQFEYDALERLIRVTDALGNVTNYAYDEVGNLISQTDANGNTTSFEYDNLGRRTKRFLPLGMEETTAYDAAGNIISRTDFNGDAITFEYDVNNRLIRKNFPNGTSEIYTYTATGQRQTVTDSRGVTSYEYDLRDRLTRRTDPDGRSIPYTYDAAGNRTSVTIPTGTTNYTYDALNRPATVTDPDGGVTTYTYDAVGNRASVTYPNGTVAEYTYDSLNRLTNLVNSDSGGGIISSYAYTLGPAGNRTRVVEDSGRTVDYTYDATYKLTQESIDDPVSGLRDISYTYDPVGNRLIKTDNGVTTTYTYDANDLLLIETGVTYTYDNNGNTLTKVSATENVSYSYDTLNRLIQANITDASGSSVVEYVYDVDGIRVQKKVDGTDVTNYLVDKNQPFAQVLLETDGTGASIVSYVYGDDLISQKRALISYYHYDGQMSTRQLTDLAANVTDTYDYDAFGLLLQRSGSTFNSYLYTGEQYDPNVGFYYLRARYYNPAIARFITLDAYRGSIYDPPSLHKYLYAYNDPINKFDPSGEMTLVGTMVVGVIIGILAGALVGAIIAHYRGYTISEAEFWYWVGGGAIVGAAVGAIATWALIKFGWISVGYIGTSSVPAVNWLANNAQRAWHIIRPQHLWDKIVNLPLSNTFANATTNYQAILPHLERIVSRSPTTTQTLANGATIQIWNVIYQGQNVVVKIWLSPTGQRIISDAWVVGP